MLISLLCLPGLLLAASDPLIGYLFKTTVYNTPLTTGVCNFSFSSEVAGFKEFRIAYALINYPARTNRRHELLIVGLRQLLATENPFLQRSEERALAIAQVQVTITRVLKQLKKAALKFAAQVEQRMQGFPPASRVVLRAGVASINAFTHKLFTDEALSKPERPLHAIQNSLNALGKLALKHVKPRQLAVLPDELRIPLMALVRIVKAANRLGWLDGGDNPKLAKPCFEWFLESDDLRAVMALIDGTESPLGKRNLLDKDEEYWRNAIQDLKTAAQETHMPAELSITLTEFLKLVRHKHALASAQKIVLLRRALGVARQGGNTFVLHGLRSEFYRMAIEYWNSVQPLTEVSSLKEWVGLFNAFYTQFLTRAFPSNSGDSAWMFDVSDKLLERAWEDCVSELKRQPVDGLQPSEQLVLNTLRIIAPFFSPSS